MKSEEKEWSINNANAKNKKQNKKVILQLPKVCCLLLQVNRKHGDKPLHLLQLVVMLQNLFCCILDLQYIWVHNNPLPKFLLSHVHSAHLIFQNQSIV